MKGLKRKALAVAIAAAAAVCMIVPATSLADGSRTKGLSVHMNTTHQADLLVGQHVHVDARFAGTRASDRLLIQETVNGRWITIFKTHLRGTRQNHYYDFDMGTSPKESLFTLRAAISRNDRIRARTPRRSYFFNYAPIPNLPPGLFPSVGYASPPDFTPPPPPGSPKANAASLSQKFHASRASLSTVFHTALASTYGPPGVSCGIPYTSTVAAATKNEAFVHPGISVTEGAQDWAYQALLYEYTRAGWINILDGPEQAGEVDGYVGTNLVPVGGSDAGQVSSLPDTNFVVTQTAYYAVVVYYAYYYAGWHRTAPYAPVNYTESTARSAPYTANYCYLSSSPDGDPL